MKEDLRVIGYKIVGYIQENSLVPPGFPTSAVQQVGWSRRRGACQQWERHSKFLSYLTSAPTLGDGADVNPAIKFLPHTHATCVGQELDYRIDICRVTKGGSTCKVGQKLGVSLHLLTCSLSA
jgi:hypothetical protein